jgi:periplasmic protein TonB
MLLVPDPSIERVRPPMSTARRWLRWAGLASVLLHAAVFGVALWWMRAPRVVLHPVGQPATVQLVMSPPGTDHNASPSVPSTKGPQTKPGAPKPAKPTPSKMIAVQKPPSAEPSHLASETPQSAQSDVASQTPRPPEPAPPETAPPEHAVAAQPASHSFAMNLGAIESDTNALVTGNIVVPPSPDIKFYNRKPSYPAAAALRGEQGTVVLLVYVRPDGLVSRVEVERSSGYVRLDDSALDAVKTWHFLPSIENGQPIGSVVPVRIAYVLD